MTLQEATHRAYSFVVSSDNLLDCSVDLIVIGELVLGQVRSRSIELDIN